jgi:C4-dicarboxylate transporter DctM subunit
MEAGILFALVLVLLFLGVPIAVSLGLSSIIIIAFFSTVTPCRRWRCNCSPPRRTTRCWRSRSSFLPPPSCRPAASRKRIIRFAIACCRRTSAAGWPWPSVLACMLFAALSGSSPATVVAIGTIAIAGMRQVGYSKEFASGVIANAGTLGILIPPSIVMVVYSAATDVSVGRMFLAGVVPGLVAGA